MNNKAFTISLALAGLAVFMIYSFIESKEAEYKTKYGSETAVVVAKKDIKELSVIHANMIDIVSKPKQFIEPDKTTTKKEVVGLIAALTIKKGEQITLNKIISPGVRTGLSRQITPGKRAVAIPVDDASAVNRLIKPGDRVDLMVTMDLKEKDLYGTSSKRDGRILIGKMIVQDVPVLAVGEWVTTEAPRKVVKAPGSSKKVVQNLNRSRQFNTITVEVDPKQALKISFLKRMGQGMDVLLRNNDDTERVPAGNVSLKSVFNDSTQPRGPAKAR